MLNQLDRFVLPITALKTAQDLEFGSQTCLKFENASSADGDICKKFKDINATEACNAATNGNGTRICEYNYNGQGISYQIIAGPVFILVFTIAGIVVSIFADRFHNYRTFILAGSLAFWSLMTLLSGFSSEYWQLALFRFGLGLGQGGCNPIAASIIADFFSAELRGSALSIYNWGIYTGYSLSFAIGSQILKALDWRWVYYICSIPGFVVSFFIIFTIKRNKIDNTSYPVEERSKPSTSTEEEMSNGQKFKSVLKEFLKPSLILLCIAGSIRNAAGFVWANNNPQYYNLIGQTADQVSSYLGWIPIVFGIIGSFVGGFVSDAVSKKAGPAMRIWVLVISQIVAAPFVAGVLFFDPPYSYWFLIPTYIIGEMWIGVCLSVVVELVPEKLRITGIGIYFFIISNIGGNMQLFIPPVKTALENAGYTEIQALRGALYIFYPGEYVVGSLLFLVTLFVLKRDIEKTKAKNVNLNKTEQDEPIINEAIHENKVFDDKENEDNKLVGNF